MTKRILVVSKSGSDSWWKSTILARSDCEVVYLNDYANVYKSLRDSSFDLLILEEWPGDVSLSDVLERMRLTMERSCPKGLIISSSTDPSFSIPPVERVLVPPVKPELFNDAVASLLGLPTRTSSRYLVRVHLSVSSHFENASIVATVATVNLSSSGMLVESLKSLQIGKLYIWYFSGILDLRSMTIPGTIVREETTRFPAMMKRYIVKFEESAQEQRQLLHRFLEEHSL